jgi:hypothetical protein
MFAQLCSLSICELSSQTLPVGQNTLQRLLYYQTYYPTSNLPRKVSCGLAYHSRKGGMEWNGIVWNGRGWVPCTTVASMTQATGGAMVTDLSTNKYLLLLLLLLRLLTRRIVLFYYLSFFLSFYLSILVIKIKRGIQTPQSRSKRWFISGYGKCQPNGSDSPACWRGIPRNPGVDTSFSSNLS